MGWDAFWIGLGIFLAAATLIGSVAFYNVYATQQDTARIMEMTGIERCLYICNMPGNQFYGSAGPQPCYEKCENNYQAINKLDYNAVMTNAKK
jgi:hypothetical protein